MQKTKKPYYVLINYFFLFYSFFNFTLVKPYSGLCSRRRRGDRVILHRHNSSSIMIIKCQEGICTNKKDYSCV